MAHAREVIRKAILAAVTGLATTGANVSGRTARSDPASVDASLRVIVMPRAETKSQVDDDEIGTLEIRELPVRIEGRVRQAADLDDAMDDICVEVEQALQNDATLGALVTKLTLEATWAEVTGDIEKTVGIVTMDWTVLYRCDHMAPTAPQP